MVSPQKLRTVPRNLQFSQLDVAGVKGYLNKFRDTLLTPAIKQLVDFSIWSNIFSNYPLKNIWSWTCETGPTKFHKSLKGLNL